MRLIFIEGVSGVGKSTLTKKLCDKLREMGFWTDCYLEFDYSNPIDFYCTACFTQDEYESLLVMYSDYSNDIQRNTIIAEDVRLIRYYNKTEPLFSEPLLTVLREHEFCYKPITLVPFSKYTRVYKLIWEQFARNATDHLDYLFFDGSLLHHPINDMMRNYCVSSVQAADHINALIKAIEPIRSQIVYLSAENIGERLHRARISRNETPPSETKIQFWTDRRQMDMSVIQQLSVPCDIFDISRENWDSEIDMMVRCVLETDEERRARIYPVILSEYNPAWPEWYDEEKENLERLIGVENIVRISHFGSTSVPGLTAKPTIDILLEVSETADIGRLKTALPSPEYFYLDESTLTMHTPPPHLIFLKGYFPYGFAERVYHIHVRYPGDPGELRFRDYLIAHPETAAEYAALKRSLLNDYEHDRDGYTEAKTEFIKNVTKKAGKLKY